jgi:hypothetical protein
MPFISLKISNSMKNNILIFLICLVFLNKNYSQTYVNPVIGLDFTNLRNTIIDPRFNTFLVLNKGFVIETPFYGVKIEQVVSKSVSLAVNCNYSGKHADAIIDGFVPYDGFNFDYYRSGLSINYRLLKFFTLGVGGNYNLMKKFVYTIDGRTFGTFIKSWQDYGISILPRFYWRNFELNSYYYKGLKSNEERSGLRLKPVESLGFSLSYKIKVLNRRKKNGVVCPKF